MDFEIVEMKRVITPCLWLGGYELWSVYNSCNYTSFKKMDIEDLLEEYRNSRDEDARLWIRALIQWKRDKEPGSEFMNELPISKWVKGSYYLIPTRVAIL